jgi:signal peptidase
MVRVDLYLYRGALPKIDFSARYRGSSVDESKLKNLRSLTTVLVCIAILFSFFVSIIRVFGFKVYGVLSGSMEPAYPTGSLIYVRNVDPDDLRIGDAITFSLSPNVIATHRIVGIIPDENNPAFIRLQTKGDANLIADSYYVSQDNMIGKVIWFAGENNVLTTAFSFFTNKVGFLGCIVVPCLLLAGLVLRNCVNNIHSELAMSKDEEMAMPQVEGSNPTVSMTSQEYEEMIHRIRAELTEELLQKVRTNKGERDVGILEEEKTDTIQ